MLKYTQKYFATMVHIPKMNFAAQTMAIRDAINSAMADEMERDEKVFLIGFQIASHKFIL